MATIENDKHKMNEETLESDFKMISKCPNLMEDILAHLMLNYGDYKGKLTPSASNKRLANDHPEFIIFLYFFNLRNVKCFSECF